MDKAIEYFSDDCIYEDTLYPKVFEGKAEVKSHLLNVASSLPNSFEFIIDSISDDKSSGNIGIQWHVESNGKQLPFTRGVSMYKVNSKGLITYGFDVPEPTIKSGGFSLALLNGAKKIISDPVRLVPFVAWMFYCWFLFLSNEAPGVNALSLDPYTWAEVKDLSTNFWLILPILSPNLSPILHPILESVFNIVLIYAALFAGFFIDGRNVKSGDKNTMISTLVTMQFLTNASFMLYLVNRELEIEKNKASIYSQPLTRTEIFFESKILPISLCGLALVCLGWAYLGRYEQFGDWSTRLHSYIELIEHDRLAFSFNIDILYFILFQGWLISDDLLRRENITKEKDKALRSIGTYLPFFGLIYYFINRPSLRISG